MTTPDFETIYDEHEAMMLKDAYEAITVCSAWEWLKEFTPKEGEGFMFSRHVLLAAINQEMKYGGHSGSSYGWTMRVMEDIAKRGWEDHKNRARRVQSERELRKWAEEQRKFNTACPCRRIQGYTTGWCGVAGGGVPACEH